MDDHPCGTCLNWWECNGVAWGTPDCPKAAAPEPRPVPVINPNIYDDRTTCGLLEED